MHKTWRNRLDRALEVLLVVLMVALLADVLLQVFSRYVLNNALSFTDELAGFLLIWVGLLGATYVTGKQQHLAIDLFADKLHGDSRRILDVVSKLCVLIFAVSVLIVGGCWLVYTRFHLGQYSASLEVPLGLVYLVLPLSGLLICLYAGADLYDLLTKEDKP